MTKIAYPRQRIPISKLQINIKEHIIYRCKVIY